MRKLIRIILALVILPFAPLYWIATTFFGFFIIVILLSPIGFLFAWLFDDTEMKEDVMDGVELGLKGLAFPFVWLYYFTKGELIKF